MTASGPKKARRSFCGRSSRRYSRVWCRDVFLPESILDESGIARPTNNSTVRGKERAMQENLSKLARGMHAGGVMQARLPELAAFLRLAAWGRQPQPQLALAGVQPQPLLQVQEPAQSKSPLGQVRGDAPRAATARVAQARHCDHHCLASVEDTAGCVRARRSHRLQFYRQKTYALPSEFLLAHAPWILARPNVRMAGSK